MSKNKNIFYNDYIEIIGSIRKTSHMVLVDPEFIPILKNYQWRINSKGYAVTGGQDLMHHFIIGFPLNKNEGDHKNRNRLDNQKDNLRIVTKRINVHNSGKSKNNTTGYKGVTYVKKSGKYMSRIAAYGIREYLGSFNTAEEANEVYKKAELKRQEIV